MTPSRLIVWEKKGLMSEIAQLLTMFLWKIVMPLRPYSPLMLMVLQPDLSPDRSHKADISPPGSLFPMCGMSVRSIEQDYKTR